MPYTLVFIIKTKEVYRKGIKLVFENSEYEGQNLVSPVYMLKHDFIGIIYFCFFPIT